VSSETADRILEAACELIAEDGIDEVRIARVAQRAGASTSLVHHYFSTREELLEQALVHSFEQAGVERFDGEPATGSAVEGLAAAMRAGVPADSAQAMDLAEQHRQHITRWFYDCNYEIHSGLGEMYVADPRFTSHYDASAPGLAVYLRDAILANVRRAGA